MVELQGRIVRTLVIIIFIIVLLSPFIAKSNNSNVASINGSGNTEALIASQYKYGPLIVQQFVGRSLSAPPGFVAPVNEFASKIAGGQYYEVYSGYVPNQLINIRPSQLTSMLLKLALVIIVVSLDWVFSSPFGLWRPLVVGTLTGLILGNVNAGLMIGSFLEFIYMGYASICGLSFPEPSSGTTIAVLAALILGISAGSSVAFAMAASLLAMGFEYAAKSFNVFFIHLADLAIDKGKYDRIPILNVLGAVPLVLSRLIPVLLISVMLIISKNNLSLVVGSIGMVNIGSHYIDLMMVLSTVGVALIAFGIALMVKYIANRRNIYLLAIGSALSIIPNINLWELLLMAVVLSLIFNISEILRVMKDPSSDIDADGSEIIYKANNMLSRRDLFKAFMLSWLVQASMNYERFQGLGFLHNILFFERKLRVNYNELKDWLRMHNDFYYTIPQLHNLIYGVVISAEEAGLNINDVRYVKASLMIPVLTMGQSAITYALLPVIFITGAYLGLHGYIYAPLVAVGIWASITWSLKYYLTIIGYKYGRKLNAILTNSRLSVLISNLLSGFTLILLGGIASMYMSLSIPVFKLGLLAHLIIPLVLIALSYLLIRSIRVKRTGYNYLIAMLLYSAIVAALALLGMLINVNG